MLTCQDQYKYPLLIFTVFDGGSRHTVCMQIDLNVAKICHHLPHVAYTCFFALVCTAFFIRPFYKMMLQKPITLQDMESVVS